MSKQPTEKQTLSLKIDRAALVKELAYVCKCVPSNPTLAILGCVLLEVDGDTLSLRTTNMDLTLTASVPAQIENSGAVCVSAKRLSKILAEMADPTVSIKATDKNEVEVTGAACKFKLLGLPDDDFPVAAKAEGATFALKGSVLADVVAPVIHAVSTDETRFVLNSVYIQLDPTGDAHAVATDGRRLAVCGGALSADAVSAIVPTDAARLIVELAQAEDVTVKVGKSNIHMSAATRTAISKLVEGTYPNWKQVIPAAVPHDIEFSTEPLKAAIHRVALVSNDTVLLEFAKGALTITGSNEGIGSGAERLKLASCPKEPVSVAFAPGYLLDALTACGDTANLGLTDGLSPLRISADRFLAVVMPKRVA